MNKKELAIGIDSEGPPPRRRFLCDSAVLLSGIMATQACVHTAQATLQTATDAKVPDEIWDLHAHLAGGTGSTPQLRMRHLLEVADRMGVQRLCVYMGMNLLVDPTPDEFRQQNDDVLSALSVAGKRAMGFVYLNPKYLKESMQELERCVADGPMVGIKLWVAMRAHHENLDPILHRATSLNAVVFQHTWMKAGGNLAGESTPAELAQLAARHPQARLICGHAGGDWELGIRAIRSSQHVAIDLGGSEPTSGFTEMAVRELGAERIIYGSDVPGRSYATQLAKVYGAELSDTQRKLILGGNLKKMLEPILTAKGLMN